MTAYQGKASMLIRKPAPEVFEAIADPAITCRFWFTRGSARLEKGKRVRWDWQMYDASAEALVLELDPARRILVEWAGAGQPPTRVEWQFTARPDGTTYVTVTESGFHGTQEEIIQKALGSTGGFSFHLAGLKALMEHGIELGLTGDHQPRG
jgi:uncharacterized protein YndB with AHSA1/START domain